LTQKKNLKKYNSRKSVKGSKKNCKYEEREKRKKETKAPKRLSSIVEDSRVVLTKRRFLFGATKEAKLRQI
jgi:hypothetical protein